MSDAARMLAEWITATGAGDPALPETWDLNRDLLAEEAREAVDAYDRRDLTALAHELADVVYVAYHGAHILGIPLDAVLAEVHRANMTKVGPDGSVSRRDDGKVLKGPNYTPPDVAGVLARAVGGAA